jgi:S1-C subfamily serine protease
MANPNSFSWTDPTTSTDGTPLVSGEVTGYTIGIRSTTAIGSVVGTYPITTAIASPTATSEPGSALPLLVADTYAAAIQSNGPVNSAWSTPEVTFTIAPGVPNPPTGFSIA